MKLACFAVALAMAGIVFPASRAEAQCSARCECTTDGCGCSLNGGNGSNCSASGDGCFVGRCEIQMTSREEAVGGDVLPSTGVGRFAMYEGRNAPDPANWEMIGPGRYIRRSCEDIAVSRRREHSAAARHEVELTI